MDINVKILTHKPREESGSKTSRKYQFQKDLSLYLLLREHNKREDYAFLFDFHEDLLISNSSEFLKELECYQIKSKDRNNWTIKNLTNRSNKKKSIIGKLYNNKLVFGDDLKSLNFITNARFNFRVLKNGKNSTLLSVIPAMNLNDLDLKLCDKCIIEENSVENSEFKNLGIFQVTSLSNEDSSTHCVGALAGLINGLNPSNEINPQLAYEQVIREISRKTNETFGDKDFNHISEIIEIKGISKSEFTSFLEKAGLYKSVNDEWIEVKNSLESDGIKYGDLIKYKKAWRDINARIIADSASIPLRRLSNQIADIIDLEINYISKLGLIGIIEHVYSKLYDTNYDEYFVKCLIIKKLNEA